MKDLKKLFDAARMQYGHTIQAAANHIGYSKTTLDRFFTHDYRYPDRVENAVRDYIRKSGIVRSINKQGLNPNATKAELRS
jgi:DNA-binding LacI/PurR family transcriptional regulator